MHNQRSVKRRKGEAVELWEELKKKSQDMHKIFRGQLISVVSSQAASILVQVQVSAEYRDKVSESIKCICTLISMG